MHDPLGFGFRVLTKGEVYDCRSLDNTRDYDDGLCVEWANADLLAAFEIARLKRKICELEQGRLIFD